MTGTERETEKENYSVKLYRRHSNTADSVPAYIIRGAPSSFYTWLSADCAHHLSGGMDRVLIDLLSCVSRRFSVVFLY